MRIILLILGFVLIGALAASCNESEAAAGGTCTS
jgi:hypothetical protein